MVDCGDGNLMCDGTHEFCISSEPNCYHCDQCQWRYNNFCDQCTCEWMTFPIPVFLFHSVYDQ